MPDDELTREDLLEEFLAVLNICEPEHPYVDDPYPVSEEDVEYGYHRCDSNTIASCGPRSVSNTVFFAADKGWFNSRSPERRLSVYTHEAGHIIYSSSGPGSCGHPPAFWREVAFYATEVRDHIEEVEEVMGEIDVDEYIEEMVKDPTSGTVDQRRETAGERRQKLADLLGYDY